MKLDRRGATARQHDRRAPAREPQSERHERRTPLVVMHVHRDPRVGGERERQRRRPRTRADDGVGDTRARPLVDERRAERGRRRDRHGLLSCPGGDHRSGAGFTQNRKCWGSILPALGRDHDVVAVDAPGHGQASDVRADLWQTSDLLAARRQGHVRRLLDGCAHGASRRPRPSRPRRWARLVSGTAGIEDPDERAARSRARRGARALDSSVTASTPSSVGGSPSRCSRRCRRALATTMPAGANTVDGLASSLRLAGTGTQDPLWDRLDELTMPVLVVSGGLDERFTTAAHRMSDAIGANATLRVIARCGPRVPPRTRTRVLARSCASGWVRARSTARRRAARRRR